MNNVAIVKATYTKSRKGAKASIRYIEHRPGREGAKTTRSLFGSDGVMERQQAYRLIDEASKGSTFFRLVVSPDPQEEDTRKDLDLWEITIQTMQTLEEQILHKEVAWVASEHNDHAPHRHVHIVAVVKGRLVSQDFKLLRERATEAAIFQRHERDLTRESKAREQEEAQWER